VLPFKTNIGATEYVPSDTCDEDITICARVRVVGRPCALDSSSPSRKRAFRAARKGTTTFSCFQGRRM